MRGFRLGERSIDLVAGTVTTHHLVERLTPNEVKLLRYLARRSGEIIPRDELLTEVWGYRPNVVSRTIDNTARRLRLKIEQDPSDPVFLHTLYGQGLRLDGVEPIGAERPSTSFVGRDDLMLELAAAVRRSRLVTLRGPAGVGKTRTAAELEARLSMEAVVVSCAAVRDGNELDRRVLAVLGAEQGPAGVGAVLGARGAILLVLDECEAAIAVVAARVASWMAVAPRLKLLATSRTALGLPGEQELPLAPLDDEAALGLFLDRVSLRDPTFEVRLPDARRVVSALDGLPLAIELAAARAPLLGLVELARMLSAPLDVLGGRGRTSMAEVLERSWSLLSPQEREVLGSASVFEGSFDLEDLGAVAGVGPVEVLECVESLVGGSMMHPVRREGRQSYHLLRVVRDRARRSLGPEHPSVARHVRWFARLGDPSTFSRSKSEAAGRARLLRSVPELWAAYRAATEPEDTARCGLVLLWALGATALGEGLALAPALSSLPCSAAVQSEIAIEIGTIYQYHGDLTASTATLDAVLPLCTEPGHIVRVLTLLAINRQRLGDLEGARRVLETARPHLEAAGGDGAWFWIARSLCAAGEDAEQAAAEAVSVARRFGVPKAEAMALSRLAFFGVARRGDWAACRRVYLRVEELCTRFAASSVALSEALFGRGLLELTLGDLDAAEPLLEQAAALSDEAGTERNSEVIRLFLARLWASRGHFEDALGLIEQTIREPLAHPSQSTALRHVVTAEIALARGEEPAARRALEQALATSRALGWGHIEAEALELLAVIELDPAMLDAAAALDANEPTRRPALAALIAAKRGDPVLAASQIALAHEHVRALGLLPDAGVCIWLRRAEERLAVLTGRRGAVSLVKG